MKRTTVKAQQIIIDELTEQVSRLSYKLRVLQGDLAMQQRDRKTAMQLAKQEAMRLGHSVRVH